MVTFCKMAAPEPVETDLPLTLGLLNNLRDQVMAVTAHVQGLMKRVHEGVYATTKGISFLEVKYQLLLSYLMDLTYIILHKVEGKSLREAKAVLRLVEIRTVLEKMRPIDQKLKYQIDKLVKAAVTGHVGENDPLQFRPNPNNMMSKLSESEDESSYDDEDGSADRKDSKMKKPRSHIKKYVPPRLAPVHYDADETETEKQKKAFEKARKRALSSSVIRELKEQYSDAPQEFREDKNFYTMKLNKEDEHRLQYEESMMVRLNLSKKEKAHRKRALAMTSQLSSLTHFGDISALTGEPVNTDEDLLPKMKKKKVSTKKQKGKKRA
ncbi:neuroguidin [Protopterus annectens]|uniref:neuroguidin n=1 Tax=Protopterus annectens TaxID=7888 RepID=UPI001CFA6169|nr:neuroguidin [Protopterus annectens]